MPPLTSHDAIALLTPQSTEAKKAFQARANRFILSDQPARDSPSQDYLAFESIPVEPTLLLNFCNMFSRRRISLGTSRHNSIVLPRTLGLDAHHLHLRFEMHTAVLLLTDTSDAGTWMSTAGFVDPQLLRHRTWPILDTTTLFLGHDRSFQLRIDLPRDLRGTDAYRTLFQRYALSLELSLPLHIKPIALIGQPLMVYEGLYLRLHMVGLARFERVHLGIRLSDGHLIAVKSIRRRTSHSGTATRLKGSGQGGSATETDLLRSLDHPHIIRISENCPSESWEHLCMEFVPCGSLEDILQRSTQYAFPTNEAHAIISQCLSALEYLHARGICHGNIRPASVLFQSRKPVHIRLCNFTASQEGADATRMKADMRGLGDLIRIIREHILVGGRVATVDDIGDMRQPDRAPWELLLKRLYTCDPSRLSSMNRYLADPWLQEDQCERKRRRLGDITDPGRDRKRRKINGLSVLDEGESDGCRWPCVIL